MGRQIAPKKIEENYHLQQGINVEPSLKKNSHTPSSDYSLISSKKVLLYCFSGLRENKESHIHMNSSFHS